MKSRRILTWTLAAAIAAAAIFSAGTSLGRCCDNPGPVEHVSLSGVEYWVVWDSVTGELCGYVRVPSEQCAVGC